MWLTAVFVDCKKGLEKKLEAYHLHGGKISCRISTFSLAYSSDINSLLQHCICSIGLCMHGSPNEGLKCNYCLSKKCDFFDKCFYYLINGESTHFKNCVIQGLKLVHQSFAEFVNYFSHSRLSFLSPHPQ